MVRGIEEQTSGGATGHAAAGVDDERVQRPALDEGRVGAIDREGAPERNADAAATMRTCPNDPDASAPATRSCRP